MEKVDLPVQLHIPGLASADQYLNISRDSSVSGAKKKKKKDKKGKKRRESEVTTDDGADQVQKNSVRPLSSFNNHIHIKV